MNATTIETLPTSYTLRAPREEDIPAILALLRDSDDAEFGQHDDWTAEDIRQAIVDSRYDGPELTYAPN